jgi:hypothetical protein
MTRRTRAATVTFWSCAIAGWAVIALGVRGVLDDSPATEPSDLARWFAGLLLLHDLVVVPAVLLVGWAVGRAAPRVAVPVRLGLAASALAVVLVWPLLRGYGAREANPTLLALPYARNLVVVLVAIWTIVAVWTVCSVMARRGRR